VSKQSHLAFAAALTLAFVLALLVAWDGVASMARNWGRDEYSYGYLVPFLAAFFIWQKKHQLSAVAFQPAWSGVALTLFGLFLILFGELGTLYVMVQYGFVVTLHGIALAALGWQGYRLVAMPLALLFFAVPLPGFLYNNLSQSLQLISSQIGVWVVRLFGISVYLEGNVIHLATMKLQVAEACNGLRYLFPLMAVGFMVAYIYRAPLWKKAIVFVSTIPITVLMNSFRIGLIGVSVEYWGPEMTEGILHDFEGWVVFMGSVGLLLAEMWLLNRIGRPKRRFQDAFHIDFPGPLPVGARLVPATFPTPLLAAIVCVLCGIFLMNALPERAEVVPERTTFVDFPRDLGEWKGERDRLAPIFVDALKFDDYLLADFVNSAGKPVNLYVAYYGSQRKGASVHSPRTCIPGDGWEIGDLQQRDIGAGGDGGRRLRVNRVVIQKGDASQLVYYWFQQRGRLMTNEYLVKWFLFQDALTQARTDGALVRLTTPIMPGAAIEDADERLVELARLVAVALKPYVPE
jgi:exosortase D (VPLPA-CTERM-specific)